MPTCQLCGNSCSQLRQSHIIPKLVYKRIREHPSSRFRDLNNITEIMQDGEKHRMLCLSCEQKFSKLEDRFARDFLDKYLQTAQFQSTVFSQGWLENYIASVAWRVLRDDLQRLQSFRNEWSRSVFEEFENTLRVHLNGDTIGESLPKEISNYIFKLQNIGVNKSQQHLLKGIVWAYPYYDADFQLFVVCTYYAELLCITVYSPSSSVIVLQQNCSFISLIRNAMLPLKSKIRLSLKKEVVRNTGLIAKGYTQNLTPELQKKIEKFYRGKSKQ